jgi:hypothetical protein
VGQLPGIGVWLEYRYRRMGYSGKLRQPEAGAVTQDEVLEQDADRWIESAIPLQFVDSETTEVSRDQLKQLLVAFCQDRNTPSVAPSVEELA